MNQRFIRWQSITRSQFSSVTNLVLALSTGLVTFEASTFVRRDPAGAEFLTPRLAIVFLVASITSGLFCAWARLRDYRLTTQVTKGGPNEDELREKADAWGVQAWKLLELQLVLFGLGAICVGMRLLR